ncbi:MAG: hypothetical protein IPJ14_14785 [Kineosporiaceae bacterium]|nr:hypothetical protein [Kineosporiaceae bacterium]MBK7623884.1 hypothetical protein [Kineosporiaceae bacterium]MBK8075556.1 hypothetical protein [Kineosporiaceae bacterium]
MPVLICDLAATVGEVRLDRVYQRLREANGGTLAVTDAGQLRDDAFRAFETGRLGESEYARHVRARLQWHGSDADLVAIFADLYGSVDVAVMEVLLDLRERGWYLVGLDNRHTTSTAWGGQYAEQLTAFDKVIAVDAPEARPEASSPGLRVVPTQHGGEDPNDPRFLARVLRDIPTAHGPRLFVAGRPDTVAAARRAGLDAHLFRGAAGLRSACLALTLTV